METINLNSSTITSASFENGVMTLTFTSGRRYSYTVSESVFRGLVTAPSAGRFFSNNVRSQFTGTRL
jgi:hypothetical protein